MFKKSQTVYVGKITQVDVPDKWASSFIGLLVGILIMVLVTLLAGCSECSRCEYGRDEEQQACYEPPVISPKMLLRAPGETSMDPQAFAYRSDWPAATGDVDLGRVTTYDQYSYNQQSLAPGVQDYSYNLFRTYRSGASVK
jgi:hypothetical protein